MELRKIVPSNKRGMGINDIYPIILVIGIAAILIAVILFVLAELKETMAEDYASYFGRNQTLNITHGGASVLNTTYCEPHGFTINSLLLETGSGVLIVSAEVTSEFSTTDYGTITFIGTNASYNGTNMNTSYGLFHGGIPCEVTEDIIDDIADFVPWIGIILLVVAAAIVVGILIRNLSGGSRV